MAKITIQIDPTPEDLHLEVIKDMQGETVATQHPELPVIEV